MGSLERRSLRTNACRDPLQQSLQCLEAIGNTEQGTEDIVWADIK